MANYAHPLPIVSPYLALGDDVYAKSLTPWQDDSWFDGQVMGDPVAGQEVWNLRAGDAAGMQTDEAYIVFANQAFVACTCDSGTNVITAVAHELVNGTRVYLRATTMPSGLTTGKAYWVQDVTADTFTLRALEDLSGGVVVLGSSGTSVTFVATTYRSNDDLQIGTIPASEVYIGEGETSIAAITAGVLAGLTESGVEADAKKARQFITNNRTRVVLGDNQVRYTVRNDADDADAYQIDFDPATGNLTSV